MTFKEKITAQIEQFRKAVYGAEVREVYADIAETVCVEAMDSVDTSTVNAITAAEKANTAANDAAAAAIAANAAAKAVSETDVGDLAIRVGKQCYAVTGDLNDVIDSGWYSANHNQCTNCPPQSGSTFFFLLVYRMSTTLIVQDAYYGGIDPQRYTRIYRVQTDGKHAWGSWYRIPVNVTINSKALLGNVILTAGDVKAEPVYPTGTIISGLWTTAPAGYLLCMGQNVSRVTYANLFAVIGTTFGNGDGGTTFGVPDLRGKVLAGYKSGDVNFGTLGGFVGETTQELQAHIGSSDSDMRRIAWEMVTPSCEKYQGGRWISTELAYGGEITQINEATKVVRSDNADASLIQPTIIVNYAIKI